MSLTDRLAAPPTSYPTRCTLCRAFEVVSADEKAAVIAALANSDFPMTAITQALKDEGHNVSLKAVIRHRRGECS